MNKYRIKVGERVLGPLTAEQIVELYRKSHIEGEEECQLFPAGEWLPLTNFDEVVSLIASSLDEKNEEVVEDVEFPEIEVFDYSDDVISDTPEDFSEKDKVEIQLVEREEQLVEEVTSEEAPAVQDKTRIVRISAPTEVEKTVVIKRDDLIPKDKQDVPKEDVSKSKTVSADEKTAMFDLGSLEELKNEVVESVEELAQLKQEEELLSQQDIAKVSPAASVKKKKKRVNKNKKRKISPILAFVFIGLLYFLLADDGDKKNVINPQYLNYSFPIANPVSNPQKAKEQFMLGLKSYRKDTYLSKVIAIKHFSQSLRFKFRKNKALNYLILDYAELLPNAKDKIKARSVLYKMIKISRAKVLKNSNVAIGTALLYYHSGLPQTAYDVIENYLRAGGKPTLKLFSYYLMTMTKANQFKNMDTVVKKLIKVKKKTPLVYIALADYYMASENFDRASRIIKAGANRYKHSVALLLKYADVTRDLGDLKKLSHILKLIEALSAEQSPVYYANFLEHLGTVSALKKDVRKAATLYRLALTFNDNFELRDKLSQLTLGGGELASNLIVSSKVAKMSREISELLEVGKFEMALLKAVAAVDIAPNSVRANLILAKLQRQRGYFERAIKTLERLYKKYSQNGDVLYQLSLAYLDAYRIADNKKLIVANMNTKFAKSFYYASSLGRYYIKIGNLILAVKWLKKSISLNPLFHKDYYQLAKLYIHHNRFKLARVKLGEAISLAPNNLEYKILFSKIYYEVDGPDAAIGYLRNVLQKHPQNARLLGEIAINYYRSGQIKSFERYKTKIDNLFEKDASFYSFLFRMAKLESDNTKAINYGLKVLQLSSGDINLLMDLGGLYVEEKDYKNAISVFNDVIERMPAYPRVHFSLSEIYLKQGIVDKAEEEADKEISLNPRSEFGYYAKANVMFRVGKYAVANKLLERSISLNGNFVGGLKLLALIKKKQNYLDQAKEFYLRARSVEQGDAEVHKQLGEIYERTGQRALALESYKVYLEINVNAKDRARIQAKMRRLR